MVQSEHQSGTGEGRRCDWVPFGAAALVLLVISRPAVAALSRVYLTYGHTSHGFLVPLVAAVMAYRAGRGRVPAESGSRWPGLPLLGAGSAAMLLARWYEVALNPGYLGFVFLGGLGLLFAFWGLCWVVLGGARVRVLALPLLFLVFALPLPESLTTPVTLPLRRFATVAGAAVLRLAGVEVTREGNVIHLANGFLGVAEACSGIRSLWVFLAVSAALIGLMRLSWKRSAALIIAAPVLAVGANMARVIVSGFLMAWGRVEWVSGRLHETVGLVTTGCAAALLLVFGGIRRSGGTRRGETAGEARSWRESLCESMRENSAWAVPAILLFMLTFLGLRVVEGHYRAAGIAQDLVDIERKLLHTFPAAVGSFRRESVGDLKRGELRVLKPADHFVGVYRSPDGERVTLSLLYWHPRRVGASAKEDFLLPHSPDWCYPGAGWTWLREFDEDVEFEWAHGETVSLRLFSKEHRTRLIAFWRDHGSPGPHAFFPRAVGARFRALLDSWREPAAVTVRGRYGATIVVDTSTRQDAARQTALDFARAILPLLPGYGMSRGR